MDSIFCPLERYLFKKFFKWFCSPLIINSLVCQFYGLYFVLFMCSFLLWMYFGESPISFLGDLQVSSDLNQYLDFIFVSQFKSSITEGGVNSALQLPTLISVCASYLAWAGNPFLLRMFWLSNLFQATSPLLLKRKFQVTIQLSNSPSLGPSFIQLRAQCYFLTL